tara:strand:- start:2343 stop:2891 length:549 start_codon:yes stop_codon:yes gene_type:complete
LTVLTFLISGCSILGGGTKQLEVIKKPAEINIMHPALPRPLQLESTKRYVVSEAVIVNPCAKEFYEPKQFNEDGTEKFKRPKMDHPEGKLNDKGKVIRVCKLGKENDWPEGYTYLDRFLDENRERNDGKILFVAEDMGDYEITAANVQEIKRHVKQLGEVIVYYKTVTNGLNETTQEGKKDE